MKIVILVQGGMEKSTRHLVVLGQPAQFPGGNLYAVEVRAAKPSEDFDEIVVQNVVLNTGFFFQARSM